MSFIPFLTAGAQQAAGPAGLAGSFIPLLLIIVIFYFFLIRPQNKKQKQTERMLAALKKGDKVITIGGIHGVISSVKDNTVIVKVDDDCKIEFNRSAISTVELSEAEKAKLEAEAAEKKAKKFSFGKKKTDDAEPEKVVSDSDEK
ncbi:MAG: preprotein translocase subunit YajC [Treponema sp.]|nr:preprotein translocase subunit YajC [Treponema sp.]